MTPDESRHLALARDALKAIKAWPEHVPAWWRMTASAARAGAGRARIIEWLLRFEPRSAEARWFRLSALHDLSGDQQYLVRLAALTAELPDADRCMSLALRAWWQGLARAGDRAALRKMLADMKMVDLLDRLSRQLPPIAPMQAASTADGPRELRRVAILAQHLSIGTHAGTAITFNLRAVLESAGVATGVFSAQELAVPEMRGYFASEQGATVPPANPATWHMRIPGKATVVSSDPRLSMSGRWEAIGRQIAEFAPDLILFVGFMSPLVARLRESYPVVGMSLHTLPPLAPVDVWLTAQAGGAAHWQGMPEPQECPFPFRFWPSRRQQAVSRADIDVPRDGVLVVTTGTRLALEMPAAWCARMVALLDAQPCVYWLLIGVSPPQDAKFRALHRHVRVLGHQPDLPAWIGICDAYLNPPRVGGGASVAMAMELGVPAISLTGGDGGDKIGEFADSSQEAYWARLEQWVLEPDLREQAGAAMQARFHDELDLSGEEASGRLLQACRLAQDAFESRQAAPAPA